MTEGEPALHVPTFLFLEALCITLVTFSSLARTGELQAFSLSYVIGSKKLYLLISWGLMAAIRQVHSTKFYCLIFNIRSTEHVYMLENNSIQCILGIYLPLLIPSHINTARLSLYEDSRSQSAICSVQRTLFKLQRRQIDIAMLFS